jgi:flagella basal body P-ring formation protein FlgA
MEILPKLPAWLARCTSVLVLLFGFTLAWADAAPALEAGIEQQVRQLALAGTQQAGNGMRVEIEVGRLDPRLRLAPCERIEPYLPAHTRLWGRSRIGLRCTQGPARWNVFLPVTVKVFGPALVATVPLPAGATIAAADLIQAEVDLAEDTSAALMNADLAVGRTVARAVNAGQSLRQAHLKPRQWFAAGETVRVAVMVGLPLSVVSMVA